MNPYTLADKVDATNPFDNPVIKAASSRIRMQADRIEELEEEVLRLESAIANAKAALK